MALFYSGATIRAGVLNAEEEATNKEESKAEG
jgi:hypothetical protein